MIAVAFAFVAYAAATVSAAQIVHVRATILGTTPEAIDVGVADGSDVHIDMAREPRVAIAEPADAGMLRAGEHVSVVTPGDTADARASAVVVVPPGVTFLHDGRARWDRPAGATMTTGRVVRCDCANGRVSLVIEYPHGSRRIAVPQQTPVVTLRPGSRLAFVAAHTIFVFATPPTDGLSLVLQSAIVGDGPLQLPF